MIDGHHFKVHISHGRALLPDGKRLDTPPFAIGDRVLLVLNSPTPGSLVPGPTMLQQTYDATVVERLVTSDNAIAH
jgi:hypothetical protein